MKQTKLAFRVICTTLIILSTIHQSNAQTADFYGTWKRNNEKTKVEGTSINTVPAELTISLNGKSIGIKRTLVNGAGQTSGYTEVISNDGSASVTITPSKLKRSAAIQWSANHRSFTETFTSKDDQGDTKQTGKQIFSLSDGGKTLTVMARQDYDGQEILMEEIFDKQ